MIPGLAAQTISPFPNPPEYAHFYTNEQISHETAPPPPAPQTEFVVFGENYRLDDEVIPPLGSLGIRELYTNKNNWKEEMKKLNRSVVVAFLDLIEILIRCPDSPSREEKMNDIHTIFINMHHLINECRPFQARDTLRLLQKQQGEQLEEVVDNFSSYLEDGRDALTEQFETININLEPPPKPNSTTRVRLESDGEVRVSVDEPMDEEEIDVKPSKWVQEKKHVLGDVPPREDAHKQEARPSIAHLKLRQRHDLKFLESE